MALSVTSAIFQQVNTPALDIRRMLAGLISGEGVVVASDMAIAQRSASANFSVDIAAGRAFVEGDSITRQGLYFAYNDGVVNLTGFTAAHATLPRIDRVCLRLRDAFHGDAANDFAFVIVPGTATAGATLANKNGGPGVPGSHLLLANVLIPAAATNITTANIDNLVRPVLEIVSNQAFVRLRRAAVQALANGATTLIIWDTEDGDASGLHDPVSNPSRITVTRPGLYVVTTQVLFDPNTTGQRSVTIFHNAGGSGGNSAMALTTGNGHTVGASSILAMAAGDFIETAGYQNSGVALNATGLLTVARVGAIPVAP
ncbi:MAG TPA: hypothetical protein VNI55_06570 [Gaiellaceae bacterium]|nr:hypothetical protein [Gaiellaceae bacterium]